MYKQILGDMKILPCRIRWFYCKVISEEVEGQHVEGTVVAQ